MARILHLLQLRLLPPGRQTQVFLQDAAVLLRLLIIPLLGLLVEHSAPTRVKGHVQKITQTLIDPRSDHHHAVSNVELELQQSFMFSVSAVGQKAAQLGTTDAYSPPSAELEGLQPLES